MSLRTYISERSKHMVMLVTFLISEALLPLITSRNSLSSCSRASTGVSLMRAIQSFSFS
jgi:hypothetical protein